MIKKIFILTVSILSLTFSQEKTDVYLTGNPKVDFFGNPIELTKSTRTVEPKLNEPPIWESGVEKSPWLAGLFSLLVPGAGEIYTENYTKGAVFIGVEITSWIISGIYNNKGDKQTAWFKDYADKHYSAVKYAEWVWRFVDVLAPGLDTSQYHLFYRTPDSTCGPPFSCLHWSELNRLEGEIDGFTHRMPYYGEQQYYELIGKYKQFSKGWDSEDAYDLEWHYPNEQFFYYGREFNKADKYYKVADMCVAVIVANHIISAVDAFWSASKYNKKLQAEVRMKMNPTPYGYLPAAEANITYTF